MLIIRNVQIDFDITSPKDMLRYDEAVKKAAVSQKEYEPLPEQDDPEFMTKYIAYLNAELKTFGDFIDDIFGDGVANQLLGSNPSLNLVYEVNDEIGAALEEQGKTFSLHIQKLQKYQPDTVKRKKK